MKCAALELFQHLFRAESGSASRFCAGRMVSGLTHMLRARRDRAQLRDDVERIVVGRLDRQAAKPARHAEVDSRCQPVGSRSTLSLSPRFSGTREAFFLTEIEGKGITVVPSSRYRADRRSTQLIGIR